jgi:glycosyltransferase involved in cell wall biosynthesis
MSAEAPVSVVVPLHNGERYVAAALESILGQTRPPREIIVVDDGSTDGGVEVAAGSGEKVRVIRQKQSGAATARNRGIAEITQPYVGFLDDDDLWVTDKTEIQLARMESHPELSGVFGHMSEFTSPDVPAEVAARFKPNEAAQPSTLISCMLIRADELRRVGPLEEGSRADFLDWYLRARDMGLRFETLDALVVRRRIHDMNFSRNNQVKRDYLKHIKASLDRRRDAGKRGE